MLRASRSFPVAALLAIGIVWPTAGMAQESDLSTLSFEELLLVEVEPVFGASRRLQPVTEAPASITIVTEEDIRRFGYRTLADILESVRGWYVTGDRNYDYVGVRGFSVPGDYSTRVRIRDSAFWIMVLGRAGRSGLTGGRRSVRRRRLSSACGSSRRMTSRGWGSFFPDRMA
jgi:hypothetical protein